MAISEQEISEQDPAWLLNFRADVFSQQGEDGVIKKVLETLPATDRWCVEFGAWDGAHLSNSRNLIENLGYSAVLIEADQKKYSDLTRNYAGKSHVYPVNAFVGFRRNDSLDTILENLPVPREFDFLSIDIDGNDYHAWNAVEKYTPKIVCIEFNPTIHTDVDYVQAADPRLTRGASLLSLTQLGSEKGYELISVLPFNAVFVLRKYYGLFNISDNSPHTLRKDLSHVTYLFSGYDGAVMLSGSRELPWHLVEQKETRAQQLPRFLQAFPANYNLLQRALFRVFRSFF